MKYSRLRPPGSFFSNLPSLIRRLEAGPAAAAPNAAASRIVGHVPALLAALGVAPAPEAAPEEPLAPETAPPPQDLSNKRLSTQNLCWSQSLHVQKTSQNSLMLLFPTIPIPQSLEPRALTPRRTSCAKEEMVVLAILYPRTKTRTRQTSRKCLHKIREQFWSKHTDDRGTSNGALNTAVRDNKCRASDKPACMVLFDMKPTKTFDGHNGTGRLVVDSFLLSVSDFYAAGFKSQCWFKCTISQGC